MGKHFLDSLFNSASIAVIGASDKANSVGMRVFYNLLNGGYEGKLYPVNTKHAVVQGQPAFASVKNIPSNVDLVVITTPAQTVPMIMSECGEKGVKAVIIISAGFSETGSAGKELEQSILQTASEYRMRIVGPNCLGIMRPHLKLNATFDSDFALPGHIALVSQSGAIVAAILDWALSKKIGFSTMVSLGNAADIDFGEILDFLALDTETKSILMYIEGIHHTRQFMSGLRAASRLKPVVVIKGGKFAQGSRAAYSHTGALVGNDDAFDAALRRAGAVRVMTIEQLFSAAELLSSNYRTQGNRLAIVTNGGGAGVIAADCASEVNVSLPNLGENTIAELNKVLPSTWSHQNPLDIIGDATPERYHAALEISSKDENIDGLLSILIPVAMSNPLEVARQVIADAKKSKKPMLACWMGEKSVKSSRTLFAEHGIPVFNTPEEAVEAFSYLADYQRNQALLLQVPEPLSPQPAPDVKGARLIIESVLAEHRKILTTTESKAILKAFGIPVTQTIETQTANEALIAAETIGFPVVMKINSPDITHKQDAGGVQVGIDNPESVRTIFNRMIESAKKYNPAAKILGVTVEKMYVNPNNRELIVGLVTDKVFGPVITFGTGGSLVEIINDHAVALPPLNKMIAKDLIAKTRAAKLLDKFRNMQAANLETVTNVLLRVSEMICELPYIQEMDINPLMVNNVEAVAVDARIVIDMPSTSTVPYHHMAICPYPSQLTSTLQLNDGTNIVVRPIRPEDAAMEQDFVRHLSPQSRYFRFMEHLQELTPAMLMRFTQIDYDREMALVAINKQNDKEMLVGVGHYIINPGQDSCEFALVIADEWQNKGIGSYIVNQLMEIARGHGVKSMTGEILVENVAMKTLVKDLGFSILTSDDKTIVVANKSL